MTREGWQGGTPTRPSMTGRMRRRSAAATCRSGSVSPPRPGGGDGAGVRDRTRLDSAGARGVDLVGVDRSEPMLARARQRITKSPNRQLAKSLRLVRCDIRQLPFGDRRSRW
jgi:hypothetical protein